MPAVVVISFLAALCVALFIGAFYVNGSTEENGATIGDNRRNGRYRVIYPDGNISQPFYLNTARDYAEMFGGRVVPKDYLPTVADTDGAK